jgi:20S proteasome alpha/beta subunit
MYAAVSGGVSDSQMLIKTMKGIIKRFELQRSSEMTVKQLVNILSNIMNYHAKSIPIFSSLIIGGFVKEPELYSLDMDGTGLEKRNYVCKGSGSIFTLGYLDSNYKENLSEEEAKTLIVNVIKQAKKRDLYSGGKIFIVTIKKNTVKEEVIGEGSK